MARALVHHLEGGWDGWDGYGWAHKQRAVEVLGETAASPPGESIM